MDPLTSSEAEGPAELQPRRRRHRAKPPEPPKPGTVSERALASAWQGAFLIMRLLTWLLAGREASPLPRWTGELWSLTPLTADEAEEDARELMPSLGDLPPGVVRFLSMIGAPVLMAQRVSDHLRRAPKPKAAPPPPAAPLSVVTSGPNQPPQPRS